MKNRKFASFIAAYGAPRILNFLLNILSCLSHCRCGIYVARRSSLPLSGVRKKIMKRNIFKSILLTAGAVALLGSGAAFANSDPNTNEIPFFGPFDPLNFLQAKSHVGLDGNIRILWDNYGTTSNLVSSNVWVLNGSGSFLATSPIFTFGSSLPLDFAGAKTNILVQGQKDGNTTIVFLFGTNPGFGAGAVFPPGNSYSVITINSSGSVVSGVGPVGPFAGTWIENIHFDNGGNIVVHWVARGGTGASTGTIAGQVGQSNTHTAWTLNEFGGVIGAAGPFGFLNTNARVVLNSSNQQVWLWDGGPNSASFSALPSGFANTLSVWVVNPNGSLVSATQYGPF